MFEFIRTHKRLMQIFLLVLIVPSFAFVGIGSYSIFRESPDTVAKVAGQPITGREWQAAQLDQIEHYRQMFGAQFDQKMFETPQAKMAVLESMMAQRALTAAATKNHLTVSDRMLQDVILGIPGLVSPDGKFDADRYKMLLAAEGMTPDIFQAKLRGDLVLQQIKSSVTGSFFAPKSVLNRLADIAAQERDIQMLSFKASDFLPKVTVSDDALKAYYEQHKQLFTTPETLDAQYVVLDNSAAAAQVTVSDADIEANYKQNLAQYSTPEQRRASHILIAVPQNATAGDKAAAKKKTEDILAQLRKDPAEFAKLAKADSQDPGSAVNGGDLGYFDQGAMVKPFADAVYAMAKIGDISNVVESQFGFHIIELTGIKPGSVKPLTEVKAQIANQLKTQRVTQVFTSMASQFGDLVYENAGSLQSVADKLHLKLMMTADGLTRNGNPALPQGVPYNNPKFLKAIFSDDAINKNNTEAIEVAPNVLIAGRVIAHRPAILKSFAQVEASIRTAVSLQEAAAQADQAGEKRLAALKANDSTQDFSAMKTVSRIAPNGLEGNELDAVMKADTSKLPAFVGMTVPDLGYFIFRISKIHQPEKVDAARRQAEENQLSAVMAQQETSAYIAALKQQAKSEIVGHPLEDANNDAGE